ncbi:MAG: polysaccharide biosynthesis tyrosine autokinase [Sphingobium sp.]
MAYAAMIGNGRSMAGDQKDERPVDMTGQSELQHLTARQAWQILRRHRMLVLGIVALSVVVTLIVQLLATPQYQAVSTLQVELNDNVGANQAEIAARNQQRVANEARTFRSRALAERVVRDLRLIYNPTFMEGETVNKRKIEDAIDRASLKLQDMTKIVNSPESDFIDVEVTFRDPEMATRIANQYVKSLRAQRINRRDNRRDEMFDAINRETQRLAQSLSKADQKVADFRREHGMLVGAGGQEDLQQLNRIATEAASANGMQAGMAARSAEIARASTMRTTAGATSPLLQQQQRDYDTLLRDKARMSAIYGPGHPDMITLNAQLTELSRNMDQERRSVLAASQANVAADAARERGMAQSEAASAGARAAQLAAQLGALTHKAYENTKNAVQLAALEREAEVARQVYVANAQRAQEVKAELSSTGVNSTQISAAVVPDSPIYPTPKKAVASAVAGSLIFALLLVLAIEMFDNKLRTSDQVRRLFDLPTFAMFPDIADGADNDPNDSVVIREPQSLFAEVARSLHAEVAQLATKDGPQSILITSPLPGDGKSVVALSLAAAASAMGRRAVVVDLDLRRPGVLQKIQQRVDGPDLVDFLTGKVDGPKALISSERPHEDRAITTYHPTVLSTREPVRDPASLIRVGRIRLLFDDLRERFDLIIINAPATLAVRDARTLTDVADSTLMVMRWGHTTIEQARASLQLLRNNVAGVVFNRVDYVEHARRGYGDSVQFYVDASAYYSGDIPRSPTWRERAGGLFAWVKGGRVYG